MIFFCRKNKIKPMEDWFTTDVKPPIGCEVLAKVEGYGIKKLKYVGNDNSYKTSIMNGFIAITKYEWKDELTNDFFHRGSIQGWKYHEHKKSPTLKR